MSKHDINDVLGYDDPTVSEQDGQDTFGQLDEPDFPESPGEMVDSTLTSPTTAPTVAVELVAPEPMDQSAPDLKGKRILDYAMSVDVDQRPAVALVRSTRKLIEVAVHQDEVLKVTLEAVKHVQAVEGFSGRAKTDLNEYFFGDAGVMSQFKATFATERGLNRQAATGGLLDAAAEVEKQVEKYGNAKLAEFDAHALAKTNELEREMHRISVSSMQKALEALVAEKMALAEAKYSRRMWMAYGIAMGLGGVAVGLGAVVLR